MKLNFINLHNTKKVAYKVLNNAITYKELIKLSNYYGNLLKREGTSPVIIIGNKSIDNFVSIFSCIKAHRCYIPVDDNIPTQRLKEIINITGAKLILSENKVDSFYNINICSLKDLIKYSSFKKHKIRKKYVYMISTSGTTGIPKCVSISYENLNNFCKFINNIYPLSKYKNINVLNTAMFSFDLSVCDIFYSVTNNHTLVALTKDEIDDYNKIFDVIKSNNINLIVQTPTFMKLLLLNKEFNSLNYPHLKCLYFCGEKLDKELVSTIFARFTDIKIINAYGPTEATSAVSAVLIKKDMLTFDMLPVGDINTSATTIDIVNDEIILKGKSVFDGYLNFDSLNHYKENGINCYKTGDTGYIQNNMLYCKGRIDSQIKYKGYRIEILDIENNIKSIKGVKDCFVIPKYDNNTVKLIKAFVILEDNNSLIDIKSILKTKIPSYMIPKVIKIIDKIPMNKNGKVDKGALDNL